MGVLSNADLNVNSTSGGAVQVTVSTSTQATTSSHPVREVWITAGVYTVMHTGILKVNIGAAATSVLGLPVPTGGVAAVLSAAAAISAGSLPVPLRLPVDDLNELYFYSDTVANVDRVDILYRK